MHGVLYVWGVEGQPGRSQEELPGLGPEELPGSGQASWMGGPQVARAQGHLSGVPQLHSF